jgi:secondary thiamine-phosphate synthase enzyme
MVWIQKSLSIAAKPRGMHLITARVVEALPELPTVRVGILHVFIQHTSAALTLNENADPDVRRDLQSWLDAVVPEAFDYTHTLEGADDMPAHIKASLMGYALCIPVRDGRLALGTWQGIYLCEYRNSASRRHLVLTLQGEEMS